MFLLNFNCVNLFFFSLIWPGNRRDGLGDAYDTDAAFASALETFAGGHNDPISVSIGGMLNIGGYK